MSAGYLSLGPGLCRGDGWHSKDWPQHQGLLDKKNCLKACLETRGCTGFDLRDPEGKKYQCYLFGHRDVRPASGLKGECFKVTTASARGGPVLIGPGACRGPGWQDGNQWPMVMGKDVKGTEGCGMACAKQSGCTAFDLRPDGSGCLLYGHSSVVPASGVPGDCYLPPSTVHDDLTARKTGAGGSKRKAYKVPEFDAPTLEADDVDSEDDEWLFEPPPPIIRYLCLAGPLSCIFFSKIHPSSGPEHMLKKLLALKRLRLLGNTWLKQP